MAGWCWMAVTLCLLLFDGNSLAAVDKYQLAPIVDEILNRYTPSYRNGKNPMFSLAVTIPYNKDTKKYDTSQLENGGRVREEILNCEVYTSPRVVAATVLKYPDDNTRCRNEDLKGKSEHAEHRTLQHINTLVSNLNKNDLLLFYVFASPCDQRCTNKNNNLNILRRIKAIKKWNNYAVVFSKIFKPGGNDIPENNLQESLKRLGESVGLRNIFRCDKQNGSMQCTSCSSGGNVTQYCVSEHS